MKPLADHIIWYLNWVIEAVKCTLACACSLEHAGVKNMRTAEE